MINEALVLSQNYFIFFDKFNTRRGISKKENTRAERMLHHYRLGKAAVNWTGGDRSFQKIQRERLKLEVIKYKAVYHQVLVCVYL